MAALTRRGMTTILPVLGIVTILSGFWLYWHVSAGFDSAYMGSRPGMAYGFGMAMSVVAFAIGLLVLRPSVLKMATAEPAQAQALRQRAAAAGRWVAWLIALAVISMAIGRYI